MGEVDVAFPRAVLGRFWSARVAQSPTCTLNVPPLGNIREGPECASRGGTLGVLRENVVPSLDPALRDPYLLSWEFSWSVLARRDPTSFSQGSGLNVAIFF